MGGNWLNKLGVLVLVVGIALFLGYGITQLGPAGKVVIGFLVGASMLTSGLLIQRKPDYVVFGRGLIGGGWAAIYFTAYAMHGIDAARVIESPIAGTAVLLSVSIAILVHSFQYHSEPATGLGFFAAFVSLNVSPLTPFSVVATLLLAFALIALAYRFRWFRLALAGIVFTYGTFALRYETVLYAQSVLWIYWLAFETYDLLNRRRTEQANLGTAAFALNAGGFLCASFLHQLAIDEKHWTAFLSVAAIAYLASTIVRFTLRANFRFAIAVSAMLAAGAVVNGLSGLRIPLALLIEAELLFVAGLLLGNSFLRSLGALFLVLPFLYLYTIDIPHDHKAVSPLAILMAATFYANRFLTRTGWYFGLGGSTLIATVVLIEVQKNWVAVVWALMTAGALWLGIERRDPGLRWQSYALALAAFIRVCVVNFNTIQSIRIETTLLVAACLYGCHLLLHVLLRAGGIETNREQLAKPLFSVIGTVLITCLIFIEVQGRLLTVACGIEGVALLAIGFVLRERVFRLSGLSLFLFCIAKLFLYDLRELDTLSRILSFIVLGLMLLGASWIYTRFRDQIRRLL